MAKVWVGIFLLSVGLGPVLRAAEPASGGAVQGGGVFEEFDEFEQEDGQESPEVFDPLIGYNRFMFNVNDKLYFWILKPLATGYSKVLPKLVRGAVAKGFRNIRFPIRFVNNALQLKWKGAGVETTRFVINSTLGIGGLFDPAQGFWRLRAHKEDFGQTLGHYGVGGGFPLVLPFMPPTNLRDALAKFPDGFLDPISYVEPGMLEIGIRAGETLNEVSLKLGQYESFKKDALDPYTYMRDALKQNRDRQIEE